MTVKLKSNLYVRLVNIFPNISQSTLGYCYDSHKWQKWYTVPYVQIYQSLLFTCQVADVISINLFGKI